MRDHTQDEAQRIAGEATIWLRKLNHTDPAERAAFAAWLLKSPKHVEQVLLATAFLAELSDTRLEPAASAAAPGQRRARAGLVRTLSLSGAGVALGIVAWAAHQSLSQQVQAPSPPPQHTYLEFKGETLGEAIAAFNRHNARQIIIGDQAVAAIRISGRFDVTDLESFVAVLKEPFGVHAAPARAGTLRLTLAQRADTPPHSTIAAPFPAASISYREATR